jgi:hypothetical protein
VRHVRHAQEEIVLLGFQIRELAIDFGDLLADDLHLCRLFRRVAALAFHRPDLLAHPVALAFERLAFLETLAAPLVEQEHLSDEGIVPRVATAQTFPEKVGIIADFADIEHRGVKR